MTQKSKRHWASSDFVVTSTSPSYDGKGGENRFGYCRKCYGDMSSFVGNGKAEPILHYNSHNAAKRAGLWGKLPRQPRVNYTISIAPSGYR